MMDRSLAININLKICSRNTSSALAKFSSFIIRNLTQTSAKIYLKSTRSREFIPRLLHEMPKSRQWVFSGKLRGDFSKEKGRYERVKGDKG